MIIAMLIGIVVFVICFFLVGFKKAAWTSLIAFAATSFVFMVADIVALANMF